MPKKPRYLYLAAALCAIVAAFSGYSIMRGYLSLSPVVVAAQDIKPGQIITDNDLRTVQMPARLIPAGVTRTVQEATGKAAGSFLAAGIPVPGGVLAAPDAAGIAGRLREYPGRQAVALDASTAITVGGGIKEGDHVVIYAVPKQGAVQAGEIASGVPVLAVPRQQQQGGAVVLALTRQETTALLAARAQGQEISLALLPAGT